MWTVECVAFLDFKGEDREKDLSAEPQAQKEDPWIHVSHEEARGPPRVEEPQAERKAAAQRLGAPGHVFVQGHDP